MHVRRVERACGTESSVESGPSLRKSIASLQRFYIAVKPEHLPTAVIYPSTILCVSSVFTELLRWKHTGGESGTGTLRVVVQREMSSVVIND